MEVEVVTRENLPEVMIDEQMITQAVSLILTNAMQYSRPGGAIIIKTRIEHAEDQEWALLTIADTGIGIPPEELGRVFERFYRGRASRLLSVPGTGLGLAICKDVVESYHGRITAENAPEGGSIFTVCLPIEGNLQNN